MDRFHGTSHITTYLFLVRLTTSSIAETVSNGMACNWCTVDSKGCGRNGGDIIYDTILTYAWKDWNSSVRIADLRPRFDSRRDQYEAKCCLLDQEAQSALLGVPIIIIIIIIII